MPRFQLLVRELGKEPRVVPLAETIIVGRSRSVDLTVDDEEVGRKQFRIGVQSSFVVLEGLGATNPTRIGNGMLKAGERTTVDNGTVICVGKTEFEVRMLDDSGTEETPPNDRTIAGDKPIEPERTIAGPGPGPAPHNPAPKPPTDGPMRTMEFAKPGAPGPGAPGPGSPGPGSPGPGSPDPETPGPGAPRPGGTRPPGPGHPGAPPASGTDNEPDAGRTMPPPRGGPGGAGALPGASGQTPGSDGSLNTMPLQPGAPRPPAPNPGAGRAKATSQPATTPLPPGGGGAPKAKPETRNAPAPKPPAAPKQPAPPKSPAPPKQPTPPQPTAQPGAGEVKKRPSTVAVPVVPTTSMPLGDDPESRMHQAQPLLFVKGDGLKQRLRLMKTVTKIGRAESADLLLPRESVSEQHAEIHFDGEQWMLHDCGGTNGTVCDGNHLRSSSQRIQRNSLIGIGTLQLIFLVTDPATASADKRTELRALQLLAKFGRLERWEANEIKSRSNGDNQSIAEIVLRETSLAPNDWANAVTTARSKPSFFDWLRSLFSGKSK